MIIILSYGPYLHSMNCECFRFYTVYFFIAGTAIKCWECNSAYDSRCGDPFSNYSVALVDCDQKRDDVDHLETGFEPDEAGDPKALMCRKTYQYGN